ncbi:MAG: hypothetical protein AB7F35_05980 [Acetobacteraceae bacterium]
MAHSDRTPGIRPELTVRRRLNIAARHAFPASLTVLAMLFMDLPLKLPAQAFFLPAVTLISVWFWSLYRPAAMPPPVVFLIGLLLDLRGYLPPGTGVLALLITHGLALRFRRFLLQQGLPLIAVAFTCMSVGAAALIWVLTSLLTFRFLSPVVMLFQAGITAALYPLMAMALLRAHNTVADPDQA